MAGLYIHIPFCASRCIYCGFYSTTSLGQRQRYVDALCREMDMRPCEDVETIYLGGGTPSQLTGDQLRQLMEHIDKVYGNSAKEVTIECNPDDVTEDFAALLASLPFNRISMGAQTFDDNRLRFLHRRHRAAQVSEAVDRLRRQGFHNISVDLMYGFPEETLEEWARDIDQAVSLQVEHLSAYCLMVEEGTPLYRMNIAPVDEETERKMYDQLIDRLTAAGYEHYEISNFARKGYRSRHNSSYWQDVPYIGIGAAAHSYDGQCRQWNASNIEQYMQGVEGGEIPCEREILDDDTRYNDRITTALRTREGLDLAMLSEKHRRYCIQEAQRFLDDQLVLITDNHLVLARQGLFVSDMVMAALMWV